MWPLPLSRLPQGIPLPISKEGKTVSLKATEDITIYHKLATRAIEKGEPVVKYGEHIGVATEQIPEGAHVHVHNVESMKEDRRGME